MVMPALKRKISRFILLKKGEKEIKKLLARPKKGMLSEEKLKEHGKKRTLIRKELRMKGALPLTSPQVEGLERIKKGRIYNEKYGEQHKFLHPYVKSVLQPLEKQGIVKTMKTLRGKVLKIEVMDEARLNKMIEEKQILK